MIKLIASKVKPTFSILNNYGHGQFLSLSSEF